MGEYADIKIERQIRETGNRMVRVVSHHQLTATGATTIYRWVTPMREGPECATPAEALRQAWMSSGQHNRDVLRDRAEKAENALADAQKREAQRAEQLDVLCTALNTAVRERNEARELAEERRVALVNEQERLAIRIASESMPPGYELVSETDECGFTSHRWQTHDASGARWGNPVAALTEAWALLRR